MCNTDQMFIFSVSRTGTRFQPIHSVIQHHSSCLDCLDWVYMQKLLLPIIGKFYFGVVHCIRRGNSNCREIVYIPFHIIYSNSCTLHLSFTQKYFSFANFYLYSTFSKVLLLDYAYLYTYLHITQKRYMIKLKFPNIL